MTAGISTIGRSSDSVDADWAAVTWTLQRALCTARFWWIAAGYFAACLPGTP
jgi:hypothetical protein